MDDYCKYLCEGGDSDIDCSSGEGKDAGENGKKCMKVNNKSNQRTPCAHWPEKSNERARGSCLLLKTFDLLMILQGSNWGWYELSHA